MEITHLVFSLLGGNMVSPLFFFFPMQRREAQTRVEGRDEKDSVSKHRHDSMGISLYFLFIPLQSFPTNILSKDSSLESALKAPLLSPGG